MFKLIGIAALAAITSIGMLSAPKPTLAAAQESVRNCTVSPGKPWITTESGVRYANANVYVSCSVGRSGTLTAQILEADPGSDDAVSATKRVYFTILAGTTEKVTTLKGKCTGFDLAGNEELYSHGNIAIDYLNSGFADSGQLSTNC